MALEINKLEDLIPYKDSLKELWQEERFQPVLAFLSSLGKEQYDTLLSVPSYINTESTKTLLTMAVASARANILNVLVILPEAIRRVEKQLEEQKALKERMARATEQGGI